MFIFLNSSVYLNIITIDDTPSAWWCMIRDSTYGTCLQQIALRLLSVTPHSVMPERLFSILNWHHSKRRNRLSPFTLEAIAEIHTFYKHNPNDSPINTGVIEDTLGDEIRSEDDSSYNNVSDDTAEEFQRTMR